MNLPESSEPSAQGQFLVYPTEDGQVKIDVRLQGETVWLTQAHMAVLFQTSKQNIGQHLKKIFAEGELLESSVVKNFFTTAAYGRECRVNFYKLDAIISEGSGVKGVEIQARNLGATHKEFLSVYREAISGAVGASISGWEFEKAIRQLPAQPKGKKKEGAE